MIAYLAKLPASKLILWCYLAWYVAIMTIYLEASPILWISAVGISVLVGIALNLATRQPNQKVNRWVVFRLFLIPFCVSSYSAMIKGKGFILLFPPDWKHLAIGCSACLGMIALHHIARWIHAAQQSGKTQTTTVL